jgi:hypothetical protein
MSAPSETFRREAAALARLLAAGVAFDAAIWQASEHGRDLDTARLVDLFNGQTASTTTPNTLIKGA